MNSSSTVANWREQGAPAYFVWTVLVMLPFTGMGIDLYTPSLPWITSSLHTSAFLVKLTISLYLLGYCLGPIIFGILSDTYGRKPILYSGLALYIVACILMVAIPNIWVMLVLRVIQGCAAAAVGVVYRAMVSDVVKPGPALQKMGASMVVAWTLGPMIAPFIGGYLQHYFGWQANFIFFIVYAAIIFLLNCFIPETIQTRIPLSLKTTCSNFNTILSHKPFWGGVILMGMVYSILATFNVVGPFLIQTVLHYTPIQFGHVALLMGFVFFIANLFNRILMQFINLQRLLVVDLIVSLLFCLVMIVVGVMLSLSLWTLLLPLIGLFFFMRSIFPSGMTACMSAFPQMAGSANALMGFLFSGITAIMAAFAGCLKVNSMLPMSVAFLVFITVCGASYLGLIKRG